MKTTEEFDPLACARRLTKYGYVAGVFGREVVILRNNVVWRVVDGSVESSPSLRSARDVEASNVSWVHGIKDQRKP